MKFDTTQILKCPNAESTDFIWHGSRVDRNGRCLYGIEQAALLPTDDILDGLLLCRDGSYVYPIRHGVLSILRDSSVDVPAWKSHFDTIRLNCPQILQRAIDSTLQRVSQKSSGSDGEWNRDEMRYYDAAVDTEDKRDRMCRTIDTRYLGRTYYTRKNVVLKHFARSMRDKLVIEVGCGTARTIAHLLRPHTNGFRYVGLDISFYRLVVAKRLIPEGEFVQASALDLPFQDHVADLGLAFGALHHLPRPMEALTSLDRVLKDEALLGLHEPIQTPKLIDGRFRFLKRLLTTYEHSVHDGEIDISELARFLADHDFRQCRNHYSISPFRTLLETGLCLMSSERVLESKVLASLLFPLDAIVIDTIGRYSRLFGPRAVTVIARRQRSIPNRG